MEATHPLQTCSIHLLKIASSEPWVENKTGNQSFTNLFTSFTVIGNVRDLDGGRLMTNCSVPLQQIAIYESWRGPPNTKVVWE